MQHICPQCNKPFNGRRNQKYCNRSHAEKYLRKMHNLEGANIMPRILDPYIQKKHLERLAWNTVNKAQKEALENIEQMELMPAKKPVAECTCGDLTHCLRCRNQERRKAFKENRLPAYRLTMIQTIVGATA